MRRLSLVLLALTSITLFGCDALRDAFSPRADVVARANDQTLTVERLAGWAGQSKQVPLDPLTLGRVSRYWVEYTLFAEALASGKDLRDSATVATAMWPVVSRLKWQRFHDRITAGRSLTPQQLDSAYQAGQYRVFQHILFRVTPGQGSQAPDTSAMGRVDAQKRRQRGSLYVDSLVIKRKVEVVSRAPAYAKAAVQDMDAARSSSRVLVKYRGGSLKVRDFARWLDALDPQILSALPQANDDQINQFLKSLAQQQLMLEQADSARVTLTAEDWQRVRDEHDSTMVTISSILSLTPQVLRDSGGKSPGDRVNFALARVNDYFDRVFHGRARFFPLPAFLADTLLAQARWNVDAAGVRRAVARGQEIRADSTQAPAPPT